MQLSPTSKKGTLSSGLEICLASSNDVVLEIITATFESRISNFAHCRESETETWATAKRRVESATPRGAGEGHVDQPVGNPDFEITAKT